MEIVARVHTSTAREGKSSNEGRRIQHTFRAGDWIWLWNTKVETLKDKLEPWWKGPRQLVRPITNAVQGPEVKL